MLRWRDIGLPEGVLRLQVAESRAQVVVARSPLPLLSLQESHTRPNGSPFDRVGHVERALESHFNDPRFVPHLALHETEAWVFAACDQLGELFDNPAIAKKLRADVQEAGGVELIN